MRVKKSCQKLRASRIRDPQVGPDWLDQQGNDLPIDE
jgi:hypothetical protein